MKHLVSRIPSISVLKRTKKNKSKRFYITEEHRTYTVVGVGGAGLNMIDQLAQMVQGTTLQQRLNLIGIHMNQTLLDQSKAPKKIHLGFPFTKGLGCASDIHLAQLAAAKSKDDIQNAVEGSNMVFIISSLVNGTGSGAGKLLGKICNDLDIQTCGFLLPPFPFEGKVKNLNAQINLEEYRSVLKSNLVIHNQIGNEKILDTLSRSGETIFHFFKGLNAIVESNGIHNLSEMDFHQVLSGNVIFGYGLITHY
eukprot:TRINITY_DN3848_c0_g1_i1.p1 TRINITY_DN3848_c0_g1~~TRINITY_DN3848_c0_g1_i1.p1  ORF type:complete len:252 (+),score=33.36 TRINITY_DN3848_c0_g1_i1:2-757(+)